MAIGGENPPEFNDLQNFLQRSENMMMQQLEIRMHRELVRAAGHLAWERDITIGQLVRDLLSREVSRHNRAKPPVRADERLVAPLRARLAGDLAAAEGWADLDRRLRARGYVLRAAGGGLALHDWPDDRRICKASELGFSYSRLMRRFRAPFPGHSHTWLADRMLASPGGEEDEDFDVTERH